MSTELWHVFRCNRCGALCYPVQHADGTTDFETPDAANVPDNDYMGHRWILGVWESWQYRGTEGVAGKEPNEH